jgi:hypothetical protein
MQTIRIENMTSSNGNAVPNQFVLQADDGLYFQSYSTVIAHKALDGSVTLDAEKWNYSRTTAKYRNMFLRETSKETEQKVNSGEYTLANLN